MSQPGGGGNCHRPPARRVGVGPESLRFGAPYGMLFGLLCPALRYGLMVAHPHAIALQALA